MVHFFNISEIIGVQFYLIHPVAMVTIAMATEHGTIQ